MKKIQLVVEIENELEKQVFKCEGFKNKDIIKAKNDRTEFIFDKTINKLIKKDKASTINIDFSNKNIDVITKDNTLSFKIDVSKYFINDNILRATYSIDNNKFQIFMEFKELA